MKMASELSSTFGVLTQRLEQLLRLGRRLRAREFFDDLLSCRFASLGWF